MASGPGQMRGRQATAACAWLARAAGGRRGRPVDDDPGPGLLECQSKTRARLDTDMADLAGRFRPRPQPGIPRRTSCAGDVMSQPTSTPIAEAYEKLRPLLFSIAYRMLGSV